MFYFKPDVIRTPTGKHMYDFDIVMFSTIIKLNFLFELFMTYVYPHIVPACREILYKNVYRICVSVPTPVV